ncbi:hypothetical protein FNH22_20360 [Fulvivirga sp. M361]|uniref:hypothetical protein n=1 Tax=Fulvivirga sp. M361 TaxID=2594266 RepID=UPI00117BBDF9|nr:hypothetical protein [Fulvivirga sp. M361]TRX53710.1 hypothetical protein FNH22_20360 [Fulvivirga sp. M361]
MYTRKIITLIALIFIGPSVLKAQHSDIIDKLRKELFYSEFDLEKSMAFYDKIVDTKLRTPLMLAYQGAAKALIAKYSWNPVTKINALNNLQKLMAEAVRMDTNNLEIRFLRFYIETNIPQYIGYKKSTEKDWDILIKNVAIVKDLNIEKDISDYILSFMRQTIIDKESKTLKAGIVND